MPFKKKKNKVTVLGIYIFLIFLLGLLFSPFYEKGQVELLINQRHQPIWDTIFSNITYLGDGGIIAIPLILVLFYKYCYFALLDFASLIHLILVHVGKKLVFIGMPRPSEFFKEVSFYKVPGVELHHWESFPSGHTTTAFMLASFVVLILPEKKKIHGLVMGIALLVGLSRVYLMEHFLMDVWAGAMLGICSSLLSYMIVLRFFSKKAFHKNIIQDINPKPFI